MTAWYTTLRTHRDMKALLADDAPHTWTELCAIATGNGSGSGQVAARIQAFKDEGFYVRYDAATNTYRHVSDYADVAAANTAALDARAIPEFTRRVRAMRGELIRAVHHTGESGQRDADNIALAEAALSGMAVWAGESPSLLIAATRLSAVEEAAIMAE